MVAEIKDGVMNLPNYKPVAKAAIVIFLAGTTVGAAFGNFGRGMKVSAQEPSVATRLDALESGYRELRRTDSVYSAQQTVALELLTWLGCRAQQTDAGKDPSGCRVSSEVRRLLAPGGP